MELFCRMNIFDLGIAPPNHKYVNAKRPTADCYKCTDMRKLEVIVLTQIVFSFS